MAASYYTYRSQVPLAPGETLAFEAGRGYYARSAPAAGAGPAPKNYAAQTAPITVLPGGENPTPGKPYVPAEPGMGPGPGGTDAPGDSGGGGGGGGGGDKPTDWVSMFWGSLGLDQATINGLISALSGITDPTQAQLLGQNYLQGTTWFKQTFPGYDLGLRAGLYGDFGGYRAYVNELNQATQQYLGRAVTSDEVTQALTGGWSSAIFGQKLQGNALAVTLGPSAQYQAGAFTEEGRLSQEELQAYGQEKAGYDTPLGQAISLRLQQAAQRMQTLFQGQLAAPNLSLGPQGVFAPGLQNARQGRTGTPDVGA